jgi:broad specificity phosphatase PhoE
LSPLGQEQVRRLCTALSGRQAIHVLYASPLRRAYATAAALGSTLGVPVFARGDLREIGCGEVDGWPIREVQARHPETWARNLAQKDDAFRWPGGESYREFRARALRAIGRIVTRHPGRRALIVTHAGVISQVMGAIHGASAACWSAYRAGNASVTTIRVLGAGERLQVLSFDGRAHLD